MPNPASTGLPTAASYDTMSVPGVVIDKVTGLWWQQPIETINSQGPDCSGGCTQAEAVAYCANLDLAGRCDWRLPTRIELVSIVDFTQQMPSINGTAFPGTPATGFWTASLCQPQPGSAWNVYFVDGRTNPESMSLSGQVRCVR